MAPKRTDFPPLGWRETSTINLGGQTTPITFCPHFHAPLADGKSKDGMIEHPDGMVKEICNTAFLNFVNTSDTYRYIEGEPCVMHKDVYDITGGCSKSLTKTSIVCCSPRCRDGTRSARVCADHIPTKWKTTTDNPLLASVLEFTASKHTGKKGFVCAKCMLEAFDEQLTIIKRARIKDGWCVDTPDNHDSIVAALDGTLMQTKVCEDCAVFTTTLYRKCSFCRRRLLLSDIYTNNTPTNTTTTNTASSSSVVDLTQ
ncbi:unnamed protein product [Vitrella brassicaformis CCMP3155]|uniref:Uncharacterized protein n=1 Tax=Vitrella brassicaformis (strain CCMP3155) TaxID=1169540 RepID=A0A0G4EMU8_VITBC|nr:unnamed protein product [Vitrella brassicaformis CCMP3155]|eukprot:CEL99152.1 unnamed protein product [Vitrella brassicaformis CCMP3155]